MILEISSKYIIRSHLASFRAIIATKIYNISKPIANYTVDSWNKHIYMQNPAIYIKIQNWIKEKKKKKKRKSSRKRVIEQNVCTYRGSESKAMWRAWLIAEKRLMGFPSLVDKSLFPFLEIKLNPQTLLKFLAIFNSTDFLKIKRNFEDWI